MSVPWSKQLEGKYEVVRKLGEGGMGSVFKVRHRLLDELRVVKTMRASLADDKELQSRFLQEAQLASRLRHPNIAELFDFTIADDGTAFIVMEYIPGISLDHLQEALGPLDVGVLLELAIQSLGAIGYLHRRKYIHRDVSPDNLMLSRDVDGKPKIKLIDLGIAKVLGEGVGLTVTGMFLGKLRYSSPEQLDDSLTRKLDGRSDLYSFGVVLYELLTGRLPFEGTAPSAIMAGHLFRPPIPFDVSDPDGRVPQPVRQAVLRALAKPRDERFRNATEFASELRALLVRYPAAPEEIERALEASTSQPGRAGEKDGATSAQARLDLQFSAEPTPTPEPEIDGPTRRLPTAPKAGLSTAEVGVLVAGARKFFELGQGTAAGEQLEAILALSPDHPEARELQQLLDLEQLRPAFTEALADGDLAAAGSTLEEAQDKIPAGAFQELKAELEAAQDHRAAELFGNAEGALGRGRAEEAAELVAEALALGSDPVQHRELMDAVDQALARNQLIKELLPAFEDALSAPQAEAARQVFDRIVAELGEDLLPPHARQRLGQLERDQKARALAAAAAAAIEEDRLEDALARLDEAMALGLDDPGIVHRRDETRRELERRRELAARSGRIGAWIDEGELEAAARGLDEAEAALGSEPVLDELRARVQALGARRETVAGALDDRDLEAADTALEQLRELAGGGAAAAAFEAHRQRLADEIAAARERESQLASLTAELEAELDAGELEAAQARLDSAGELAASPELETLRAHLAELRREAMRRQVEADAGECLELAEAGRFQEAYALLDRTAERAQGDAAAAATIAEARTSVQQRERAVEAENQIEALIAQGDLAAARAELGVSEELLHAAALGGRLADRLTELEHLAEVRGLLAEGERHLSDGDFATAGDRFGAAAEVAPEDDHVRERLAFARRELSRLEELGERVESAAQALDAGRLDDAGDHLDAADDLGSGEETAALRRQLEESTQVVEALERALRTESLGVAQSALELLRDQRGGPALAGSYAARLAALSRDSFDRLVGDLKTALARRDLAGAEAALEAVESHPLAGGQPVVQLSRAVDALRQRRQAEIASARRRISRLLESGKLKAASVWLGQLSELVTTDPVLAQQKADLDRRLEARQQPRLETLAVPLETISPGAEAENRTGAERPGDAALLRTVGDVAAAFEAGNAARARQLLERAEATWGRDGALDAAWDRLARLEREQEQDSGS